jgi:adenylate cyclase
MTATGIACATCGTEVRATAKFCDECGSPIGAAAAPAEYKQMTVVFADVVRSMDIAAAVGAERLREIMTQLVEAASAVVQRFGGTVDKFTGDGIMAIFGAPVPWRTTRFARAWRRWESKKKRNVWRAGSLTKMG